ncbi:transposase [Streptomyces sp. NPDC046978]|uniref:transposase n=1 Tax=unclassified Streptomyces TaxID=2593676 RepID=UPI0033CC7430
MIRRHELSDAEWEFVGPLPVSLRGRKRLDDRKVLNGIVWKFRTGTAWRDVPERYGPWATLHTRFRRWALDGTFERMPLRPGMPRSGMPTGQRPAKLPTAMPPLLSPETAAPAHKPERRRTFYDARRVRCTDKCKVHAAGDHQDTRDRSEAWS